MRYLTAEKVFPVTSAPLENGVLIVEDDGTIKDVLSEQQFSAYDSKGDKTEHVDGYIIPGFINTHCHLELSYLKGIVTPKTGMANFIRELLRERFKFSEEQMQQSYIDAENEMLQNGIVAVGDISNF